jgi:hypothetical protein
LDTNISGHEFIFSVWQMNATNSVTRFSLFTE